MDRPQRAFARSQSRHSALAALLLFASAVAERAAWAEPPAAATTDSAFAPRSSGAALEFGLGVRTGATPLGRAPGPAARLFAGYATGRLVIGLGIELSGAAAEADSSGAALLNVAVAPGIRVTLLRSADRKLELFGQLDVGIGHTFGDAGGGWDTVLGLPPGTNIANGNLRVFGAIGPALRYWIVPRFAVGSTMLLRGDWSRITQEEFQFEQRRLDFNLEVGLHVLAVL